METLNSIIAPYSGLLFVLLAVVSLVLGFAVFRLSQRLSEVRSLWSGLSNGADGENLERLITRQTEEVVALRGELSDVSERVSGTESKLRFSKRYVGLLRFNAFEDVGGDQSFSLAVYDEEGNGAVLTSQVGRSECRVFGKPLVSGKSEVNLTAEEQKAIELAASVRAKPRTSR